MRIQDAKLIQITDWLASRSFHPAKTRTGRNGLEYWYHSPLRKGDSTPSFIVNIAKNIWWDNGLNEGGNILNLAARMCGYDREDIKSALSILDRSAKCRLTLPTKIGQSLLLFNIPQESKKFTGKKEKSRMFEVTNIRKLKNTALIQYLSERKIDIGIAQEHLQEVYYTIIDEASPYKGKIFFALGFLGGDGFEIRNRTFKGFTGLTKDISIIKASNDKVMIFEGFMDFLSYLTAKKLHQPDYTSIVLNSTNLIDRARKFLEENKVSEVDLFFDNDIAGRTAKAELEKSINGILINDKSTTYFNYNDLNEWLINEF